MSGNGERPCSLLVFDGLLGEFKTEELRSRLEKGDTREKIGAMKKIVVATANGQMKCTPQLLLAIIRFVMPEPDRTLKKLLLLFWETVDKVEPTTGKLRPEFILACNMLMRDLNVPNEFICGFTLRLLTHIREAEMVEPLVASVRAALENKHAFVRRNAVWTLCAMYKNFPQLVPNAPDLVYAMLDTEADNVVKRNAVFMLYACAPERATAYIGAILDQVPNMGETMQLTLVQTIVKIGRNGCTPHDRARYIECLNELLTGAAPTVRYEAAGALVSLTVAPSAVRAAALAFIELLVTESDNNVKYVVLNRLEELSRRFTLVMQDVVMDLLRGLACPTVEIRRKTLAIALELVTQKNVAETVQFLKRELSKTNAEVREDKAAEYRQLLVQAVHQCAVRYPSVAADVVHVLMDYIQEPISRRPTGKKSGSSNDLAASAYDVIAFIREAAEKYPDLRETIITKLSASLGKVSSSKVYRAALWVLGEYSDSLESINTVFTALKALLRDIPAVIAENLAATAAAAAAEAGASEGDAATAAAAAAAAPKQTNVKVLSDGTYATQAAAPMDDAATGAGSSTETAQTPEAEARKRSPLLGLLMDGDHFLASVVGYTLTKLAVKASVQSDVKPQTSNRFSAEVVLLLAQLLRLGRSHVVPRPMDSDSQGRIILCLNVLTQPNHPARAGFVDGESKKAFAHLLEEQGRAQLRAQQAQGEAGMRLATRTSSSGGRVGATAAAPLVNQADDLIRIRQLTAQTRGDSAPDEEEEEEQADGRLRDETTAIRRLDSAARENDSAERLSRVVQLTGFGDPLYAEAFVFVHQYDVALDVIVTNQTSVTLQNVTLELATVGDLKLFDRPEAVTIGVGCTAQIKASLKVSSTETAIIFGTLTFEVSGQAVTTSTADRNCVPLNELRIDIIDYIRPATCTDIKFRQMWAEFEWENKISVAAFLPSAVAYLNEVLRVTNMNCLTPESALSGNCAFLAANLYARSIFGEDALANVSVEHDPATGKVNGFVRIRSKTQGIALSLGDKIVQMQKQFKQQKGVAPVPLHAVEEAPVPVATSAAAAAAATAATAAETDDAPAAVQDEEQQQTQMQEEEQQ